MKDRGRDGGTLGLAEAGVQGVGHPAVGPPTGRVQVACGCVWGGGGFASRFQQTFHPAEEHSDRLQKTYFIYFTQPYFPLELD